MPRIARVFGLVVGFAALSLSSCGGDDTSEDCKKSCATAATLMCTNETEAACNTTCENLVKSAGTKCKSQVENVLSCTAARPASDFECDADGESTLKEGICEQESGALFECILGGA